MILSLFLNLTLNNTYNIQRILKIYTYHIKSNTDSFRKNVERNTIFAERELFNTKCSKNVDPSPIPCYIDYRTQ